MYLQKLFNIRRWRTVMTGILHSLNGSNILTVGCEKSIRVENYAEQIASGLINITNNIGRKFSVYSWCIKVCEDSLGRAYHGVNLRNKSPFIVKYSSSLKRPVLAVPEEFENRRFTLKTH